VQDERVGTLDAGLHLLALVPPDERLGALYAVYRAPLAECDVTNGCLEFVAKSAEFIAAAAVQREVEPILPPSALEPVGGP
jgi:hypothetical protein